ncbi:MAG: ABC1 kinase family protein [Paracoccaceae bacterium]
MPPHDTFSRPLAVPGSRLSRLARLGGTATGIAGGAALGGLRELARGRRPELRDLLLTPGNAARLADQLARMRGAAMKVGQLVSMDAGELLPPEIAAILSRLREEAHVMPPRQLRGVLDAAWGTGWLPRFARFDPRPVAAASIGQVHRARSRDGQDLAIKVQYPGVRRSIDSDVANLGALIRVSGLLPPGIALDPLLDEARRQLHEEADYLLEADRLEAFRALLADDPDFLLPELRRELITRDVLAMSFVEGVPVERMDGADQQTRDRIARLLLELTFRELFDYRLMQTDPNFGNFRYAPDSGRIVLLDFGATRAFDAPLVEAFRSLLRAGRHGDRAGIEAAALEIGYLSDGMAAGHRARLVDLFVMSMAPLQRGGVFDFGNSDMARRMTEAGMEMRDAPDLGHVPPVDALFLQRKFAGIYLLATRLRARVNLDALIEPHLG